MKENVEGRSCKKKGRKSDKVDTAIRPPIGIKVYENYVSGLVNLWNYQKSAKLTTSEHPRTKLIKTDLREEEVERSNSSMEDRQKNSALDKISDEQLNELLIELWTDNSFQSLRCLSDVLLCVYYS